MSVTPPSPGDRGGDAALRIELEQQLTEAMESRRALQALLDEQKSTDAALRASEALLNTSGEIARTGAWELDAATPAVRWTDQVYAIHEVPVGEVVVLAKAIDFYHPEDRPKVAAAVQAGLERGESYDLEVRLITAKGRLLWVRASGRAVREGGRVVRLSGTFQDITERRLAYERLDQLIATIDGVVWEADVATFAFTFVSEQAERIFGYPLAEWTANPNFWVSHLHPEDRDQSATYCMTETMAGRNHGFEYRMFRADGRLIWVHDLVSVVTEGGRPKSMRGLLLDITARKTAELAVKESETRYRSLFNLAPDPIMLLSTETGEAGRILDANDLAASIHGYTREELLTMTVADLDTVDAAKHAPERIARLRAGERLIFEVDHRRKDGTVFPTEVTASCVEFAGRICILAFNRDITERKRAAAALRDAETRWQFALEAAQDGVWDWNIETGEVFFSARWKSMLGFAEHEVGASLEEFARLAHPEDVQRFTPNLNEHLAGRSAMHATELRMRCKDGSWKWVQARGKVIERAADGTPRRMIGTHTDIDEIKRREENERVLVRRLDLALAAGRFGTFELDLKTGRALWDERAFEIVGLKPRAEGPSIEEIDALVVPEDRARRREIVEAARMGIDTPVWEFRLRTPAGEVRTIVRRAIVRRAEDGTGLTKTGVLEDVTAQRAAELKRRADLDRHNTIFNSAGSGLILQQADGAIIEANPAAERILGVTREQMLGRDSMDPRRRLVDADGEPIDASQAPGMVTLRTGRPVRNHTMGVHWPDGTLVWLSVNTEPILDTAGRVAQVAVSFTDVTAERRADERARIALRASRVGAWRHNPRTKVSEWDARMFEIYGWKGAPPDHAAFLAMVLEADRPLIENDWGRVMSGPADFEYVFRIKRPDGAVRSIRAVGTVQRDATGAAEWITGINEDVTEAHERTVALGDLNERLQLALRASGFGIWEFYLKDNRLEWDERLFAIYGLSRQELGGSIDVFRSCVLPDDRAAMDLAFAGLMEGRAVESLEFRIRRRSDGAERVIEANGYLLRDEAGAPVRLVGMNRDITKQKETEAKHRQVEEQLFQSQKLETLGTLAGGIAHDFNNLLTGMLGFSELSQDALPPDHQARRYLDHVIGGGLRARDLVKRLLLFARRGPEPKREPVQLEQLVTETLPLLSATLPAAISIQSESVTGAGRVMGDAGQLQQALMNLVVNAAHAIGSRPGLITLRVRPTELGGAEKAPGGPGPYACLEVTDTGCGMDEATQARIFDPFFTTKKQGEGSGLGLSIVHGIVREHRGLIRVRSAPGQGTTFEIVLPVTHEAPVVVAPPPAGGRELEGTGRRVLVVDDEESVRLLTRALLLRAGFRVEVHANAESAARMFAAAPADFAIVLTDLSMPGRSGAELIRELRALRPELPAVLMSGDHDPYIRTAGPEAKDVILLSKPFSTGGLFAALRRGLDTGLARHSE